MAYVRTSLRASRSRHALLVPGGLAIAASGGRRTVARSPLPVVLSRGLRRAAAAEPAAPPRTAAEK